MSTQDCGCRVETNVSMDQTPPITRRIVYCPKHAVEVALRAALLQWDEELERLRADIGDYAAKVLEYKRDRVSTSTKIGALQAERDALRARIAELEAALDEAEGRELERKHYSFCRNSNDTCFYHRWERADWTAEARRLRVEREKNNES